MVTEVVNVNGEEYVELVYFCNSSGNLPFFFLIHKLKKTSHCSSITSLDSSTSKEKKSFYTKPVFDFLKLPPIHSNLTS